jgi:hypothetical protein
MSGSDSLTDGEEKDSVLAGNRTPWSVQGMARGYHNAI